MHLNLTQCPSFELVSWTQVDVLAVSIRTESLERVSESLQPLFYASFVVSFSGDLYLSVVLCYYLFRSRTGFQT
jgi:hypothetical protein